jgi:hypothetical protein
MQPITDDVGRLTRIAAIGSPSLARVAQLIVTEDALEVRLGRWERMYALRGDLVIPWDHIDHAEYSHDPWQAARGWRVPAGVPGLFLLGGLRHRDGRTFVALYRRDPGVVLQLRDEPYRSLVVSSTAETARAIVRRVTTGCE